MSNAILLFKEEAQCQVLHITASPSGLSALTSFRLCTHHGLVRQVHQSIDPKWQTQPENGGRADLLTDLDYIFFY
jgi:hypothetical protein